MTTEQEQKGINVRQHKRLAMGEKLDGQKMQGSGTSGGSKKSSGGGLSHIKPKK